MVLIVDPSATTLSWDQSLLDKVDKLRELGMQDFIPLPQIVVVGDQSSGKSTVLESISGVTFPKDAQMCTSFATEVMMRPDSVFSAEILLDGKPNPQIDIPKSADEVEDVIRQATKILVGEDKKGRIYDNILTVKLRGPALPSLTLVDLPGYVHTHSEGQDENIVENIRALAEKYLKSPSTIVLAVIPANRDFETNIVIQHIRKFDKEGDRTLCVVTKPDLVDRGAEGGVMAILSGEKMALSRGYHIVKSRNYEDCQAGVSREAVKRKEASFFSNAPWTQVNPSDRGIDRLVAKLSEILTLHVQKEFPGIKKQINDRKQKFEKQLGNLGPSIENDMDRFFLVHDSITRITQQLKQLIDGKYSSVDIGSDSYIRAHVQNFNQNFHSEIVGVTRSALRELSVAETMKLCKGRELKGMIQFEPFVILYRRINCHWSEPTRKHVGRICDLVGRVSQELVKKECPSIVLDYFSAKMSEYIKLQKKKILGDVDEILDDEMTPLTCLPFRKTTYFSNQTLDWKSDSEDDAPDRSRMREFLRSYCDISAERYLDAISLYTIERNLFKHCDKRITEFFSVKKCDLSVIRETNSTRALRKTLIENIGKCQRALQEF